MGDGRGKRMMRAIKDGGGIRRGGWRARHSGVCVRGWRHWRAGWWRGGVRRWWGEWQMGREWRDRSGWGKRGTRGKCGMRMAAGNSPRHHHILQPHREQQLFGGPRGRQEPPAPLGDCAQPHRADREPGDAHTSDAPLRLHSRPPRRDAFRLSPLTPPARPTCVPAIVPVRAAPPRPHSHSPPHSPPHSPLRLRSHLLSHLCSHLSCQALLHLPPRSSFPPHPFPRSVRGGGGARAGARPRRPTHQSVRAHRHRPRCRAAPRRRRDSRGPGA